MPNQHEIAMININQSINTWRKFNYEVLCNKILKNGGILRTGIMMPISKHLENLREQEILIRISSYYVFNPIKCLDLSDDITGQVERLKNQIQIKNLNHLRQIYGADAIRNHPALLKFVLDQNFKLSLVKKIFLTKNLSDLGKNWADQEQTKFPDLANYIRTHTFN